MTHPTCSSMGASLLDAVKKYDAVKCNTCGWIIEMNEHNKARAFKRGWPECCGETMSLHVTKGSR